MQQGPEKFLTLLTLAGPKHNLLAGQKIKDLTQLKTIKCFIGTLHFHKEMHRDVRYDVILLQLHRLIYRKSRSHFTKIGLDFFHKQTGLPYMLKKGPGPLFF